MWGAGKATTQHKPICRCWEYNYLQNCAWHRWCSDCSYLSIYPINYCTRAIYQRLSSQLRSFSLAQSQKLNLRNTGFGVLCASELNASRDFLTHDLNLHMCLTWSLREVVRKSHKTFSSLAPNTLKPALRKLSFCDSASQSCKRHLVIIIIAKHPWSGAALQHEANIFL